MTRHTPIIRLSIVAAALAVGGTLVALAGPLDPPAGPITPTFKTLSEVEPRTAINLTNTPGDNDATPSLFKITQSGSYYFTGNVTGVAGKHGIEIAADNVTIDLMGFKLTGVTGALSGIVTLGTTTGNNAVIRNGHVSAWPQAGVITSASLTGSSIEDIVASDNGGAGIAVGGSSRAVRCTARNNSGSLSNGFQLSFNSKAEDCIAVNNANSGFLVSGAAEVINCVASSNDNNGFLSNSANGTVYIGCIARGNIGGGFQSFAQSVLQSCRAEQNTVDGFFGNTSQIINCEAINNDNDGFQSTSASFIKGCFARLNGNTASNDGAGFHLGGGDNHIEGCSSTSNDRGYDVDGVGNLIVRNSATANTFNYDIAIGNTIGGIIAAGTNAVAVNGSSASGTIGTTDPWSNVSY